MSMVFCRGCGKEIHESAPSCPGCGAPQQISASQASTAGNPGSDAAPLADSWKTKFALIEKAGGVKMPGVKNLAFGERMRAIFNIWGFLFGPIYYCVKGMWRKAISLIGLAILIVVTLEIICSITGLPDSITNFVAAAIFATRANIDYYKKMKLGDNGWW